MGDFLEYKYVFGNTLRTFVAVDVQANIGVVILDANAKQSDGF